MIKVLKILSLAIVLFLLLACYFLLFFYLFPAAGIGWFMASVAVLLLIGYLLYYDHVHSKWKKVLVAIASARPHLSKEDYIQMVIEKGYEPDDINACYEIIDTYFKLYWGNIDFSIYPEDDIFRLYRIDDEDITDEIEYLFEELGLTWPNKVEIDTLNVKYNDIFNIYYLLDAIEMGRELKSDKEG